MAKSWFITGASSGFGYAMTEKLLARGDRVTATIRKAGALDELKSKFGDRLGVASLELTDSAAIRKVVDEAFAAMGTIDVVVNNAGYGLVGAAEEVSDEQIRHQIEVNVIASIQVVRAAIPHLRKQGGGLIMQVSSEGGQVAYPGYSLYHMSKWAIEGFIESVSLEVKSFGIDFTIIEPGATQTGFRGSAVRVAPLPIYDDTPLGAMRKAATGGFMRAGDVNKSAQVMIDTADRKPVPKRVVLGAGPYNKIREAYLERLKLLDDQKEVSFSTDQ